MSSHVSMEEAIDLLIKVQEMDRVRDRLQRKLDQVPKKLKSHTDGIASLTNDFTGTSNASGVYPPGETFVNWTVTDPTGTTVLAGIRCPA